MKDALLNKIRKLIAEDQLEQALEELTIYADGLKGESILQSYNFILDGYSLLEERPQWLAQQYTVFYYNKAHAEKATEIAKYMSSLTSQKIITAIGAGTGIPKDLKDNYISIHLIDVK